MNSKKIRFSNQKEALIAMKKRGYRLVSENHNEYRKFGIRYKYRHWRGMEAEVFPNGEVVIVYSEK